MFLNRVELAELLGVHPRTLDQYRRMSGFPKPLLPGGRPIWSRAEVERWANAEGRR